jgi:hypothetical protein
VHDGIQFEKRGVPAAVALTEPFLATGELTAKMAGLAGYPFIVIPHPISRLDRAQLHARAEEFAGALVALLTDPTR